MVWWSDIVLARHRWLKTSETEPGQWFVDISSAVDHLTRRGNYVFDQATEKEQNDAFAYRFSVHRAAALHRDLELDEEKTAIEEGKVLSEANYRETMSTSIDDGSAAVSSGTVDGAQTTKFSRSVDMAYRYCELLARSHYENFPIGSFFIPKSLRKHFYSIYAFARTADDFADEDFGEGYGEQQRLDLLAEWREMLRKSFAGRATHPIFIALGETQKQFHLPITLFEDLLSAFTQDATTRRYQNFKQLLDYCRRSANPIGRLILLLFGYRDEQLHLWSDDICTALQLTNHWQDVEIDLRKNRIYVPAEDLTRFDLSEEDLKRRQAGDGFRRLMAFEVARTRNLFNSGQPLCFSVGGRLGLELRAVCHGGSRILDRIEKNQYDVFLRRPTITFTDQVRILFVAMIKGALRQS